MSLSRMVFTDILADSFSEGMLFASSFVRPKTQVEIRIIQASAFIRSTNSNWFDQLQDKTKCQEWTTDIKRAFNLADKDVEYVLEELKYYALLKENAVSGEELSGVDRVWINDRVDDEAFKLCAAILEEDYAKTWWGSAAEQYLPAGSHKLVDPFMYAFSVKNSPMLCQLMKSPKDALDFTLPRSKPGSFNAWQRHVNDFHDSMPAEEVKPAAGKESQLATVFSESSILYDADCWLPTDFYVSKDGPVSIQSYINNLHPTQYEELYQSIAKVFARFVPLLEQVATDMVFPRNLRVESKNCVVSGMQSPWQIIPQLKRGKLLLEQYSEFLVSDPNHPHADQKHELTKLGSKYIDVTELTKAWAKNVVYTEPEPQPFAPPKRSLAPQSLRGRPLQVSTEIVSINLTPDNPVHEAGEWKIVGYAAERIFAVGYYFYDVENIATSEILFREPVEHGYFEDLDQKLEFCMSHNVDADLGSACHYSQTVGGVEIRSGRHVCLPNMYQTKMPAFELADKTKNGHVKYIAFYVVDPTTRLLSTDMIPPQQPNWARSDSQRGLDLATESEHEEYQHAILNRESLAQKHEIGNLNIGGAFDMALSVEEELLYTNYAFVLAPNALSVEDVIYTPR